jgi:hypothetical protein
LAPGPSAAKAGFEAMLFCSARSAALPAELRLA